jgi:DNA-binding GntR family transcriptional regulator
VADNFEVSSQNIGLSALRSDSLATRVVDAIIDSIALGTFKPGQRLIEADVAAELGVSRLPVREAFKMLATQGILELLQYRGAVVAPIDPSRLDAVREVRTAIEQISFERAAKIYRAEPARLKVLDGIIESMKRAEEEGDKARLVGLDIAFHYNVVLTTKDPFLLAQWQSLAAQLKIIFSIEASKMTISQSYVAIHLHIRYALSGDVETDLRKLAATHIAGASKLEFM